MSIGIYKAESDSIIPLAGVNDAQASDGDWEVYNFEVNGIARDNTTTVKQARINRKTKEFEICCEFSGTFNNSGIKMNSGYTADYFITGIPVPVLSRGGTIPLAYWPLNVINSKAFQCRAWVKNGGSIAVSVFGDDTEYTDINFNVCARYHYSGEY